MSAVLLAVFNDYEAAERVRVLLVRDGFPTDRVELTASCEMGRAGCEPADSLHGKCVQYFRTTIKRRGRAALSRNSRPACRERSSDYHRGYRVVRSRRHVRPRFFSKPSRQTWWDTISRTTDGEHAGCQA